MGKCELQVTQHIYVFRGGLSCGFGLRSELVGAVSLQRSGYQFVMCMLIAKVHTRMVIHLGPPPEVTDSDPRRGLRGPATEEW